MFIEIAKWSIRTVIEWEGLSRKSTRWFLYRDETKQVCELDITELRKLKEFFANFLDPFETGNPEHVDKMK